MELNGLFYADVPLRTYSLSVYVTQLSYCNELNLYVGLINSDLHIRSLGLGWSAIAD